MPRYSVKPQIPGGTKHVVVGAWDQDVGPLDTSRDQILLGRLNENGPRRNVYFDATRESVIAIFGKRGSGKSFTLGVIAESLCNATKGSEIGSSTGSKALLLFDTLNVFWTLAQPFDEKDPGFQQEISRLRQWNISVPDLSVDVWIPGGTAGIGSNSTQHTLTVGTSGLSLDEVLELADLDANAPTGQLLADAWGFSVEAGHAFLFADVAELIETHPDLQSLYSDQTIRAVQQRLRHLAKNPIFDAQGTDPRHLLKPGSLAVVEMGQLTEVQRSILTTVVIRRIHRMRQEASDIEKHLMFDRSVSQADRALLIARLAELVPPCSILVDEAQTVFPSDRATKATDAFVSFVKEGRNFGLSFVLATQQPASVDQRILSQVDTVLCHTLAVEPDIQRMRANLKNGMPNEIAVSGRKLDTGELLRSLEPGQAILSNSDFARVICIEIRPRVTPHAGSGFSFSDSLTEMRQHP